MEIAVYVKLMEFNKYDLSNIWKIRDFRYLTGKVFSESEFLHLTVSTIYK